MNRRDFTRSAAATAAVATLSHKASPAQQAAEAHAAVPAGQPQQIAMLLYPGMFALDLVGPHAFLAGLMNVDVHLIAKTMDPIPAGKSLKLLPSATLKDCPKQLEVLFVPGGFPGTIAAMQDDETLEFLADRGSRARYVTSVCTGSLVLGAAGLLKGYRATSHWATLDLLPLLGATPVEQRVVEDRNRLTGGGVTSGMDFAMLLAARLRNVEYAEMLQLMNEYDPQPPFHAGTPKLAGPELTAHLNTVLADGLAAARTGAVKAQKRMGLA
jgi:putative intracellular protease/amidase